MTPPGILSLLGHALGCMGLTLEGFCALEPAEFAAACKAYAEEREQGERRSWERMRLLAAVCIQPHVRKRVSPQQLIPLPWDKPARKEKTEIPSAGQALRRLEERMKKNDTTYKYPYLSTKSRSFNLPFLHLCQKV